MDIPRHSHKDGSMRQIAQPGKDWYDSVPRNIRAPILIGMFVLIFGVGGFFLWAAVAPIQGAVIAGGNFVATGQNKMIQHLEGGVIRELLVKEGDVVNKGQVLIRLDPTDPEAQLSRLKLREIRALALRARLNAEISGYTDTTFPPELLNGNGDRDVASIIEGQLKEFRARRDNLKFTLAAITDGISSIRESIIGNETQITAVKHQLTLIIEELEGKRDLYEKGYVRKSDYLALERAKAGLEGQIGQLKGAVSDARERISREEQRILQTKTELVRGATEQLRNVETELDDVRERIRVAENASSRVEIKAPMRGAVVKMHYNTPGGVIGAGKDVLELLPLDESLIIEARVRPQDIDSVHVQQAALVRLVALNQRVTPMVPGKVTYVSADAVPDERASRAGIATNTYVVRVAIDENELHKVSNFTSTPGMPVEIFAKTNERTFLSYLLKPVMDSFDRSFRER